MAKTWYFPRGTSKRRKWNFGWYVQYVGDAPKGMDHCDAQRALFRFLTGRRRAG